ncbi:MAG: prepilin peptidase [Kiloniellales bacterium]
MDDVGVLWVATVLFCLLSVAAAVFDVWKFMIPNTVSVAVAALFFPTVLLLPDPVDWLSHLGAILAVFVAGLVAYRFRVLGAGDVKLLSAVSLWVGLENLPLYLLLVACGGGAVAGVLLALRWLIMGLVVQVGSSPDRITLPRLFLIGEPIPYGVGIAAASIYLASQLPWLGALL